MGHSHVLVTGASGGIGTAIVRELLNQGFNVTATDLAPFGQEGTEEQRLREVSLDVTNPKQIADTIDSVWNSDFTT